MKTDPLSRFLSKARTLVLWLACAVNVHCVNLQDQNVKTWGTPERIGNAGQDPNVAISATGDAVAIWVDFEGTDDGTFSSRYAAADGAWTAVEEISRPATDARDGLAVAMNASGAAVAVWTAHFTADNVWANLSGSDGTWSNLPLKLDQNESIIPSPPESGPDVSMNANGAAVAVWVQVDAPHEDVWAARLRPGGTWDPAIVIEDSDAVRALGPQVAVDADGNAIAVWAVEDGAVSQIWSNRYTVGAGWSESSQRIGGSDTGYATDPRVGVDDGGNAIAVWSEHNGATSGIWSNRYTPEAGWGATAVRIQSGQDADATDPDLAVTFDGRAVAVWSQSDGSTRDIWSSRFDGRGWTNARPVESNSDGSASAPRVGVDSKGAAVVVWRRTITGQGRIWASRSTFSGNWGEAVPIDAGEGNAGKPRIAVDPSGNAVAAWAASGGPLPGVWANLLQ